MPNSNHKRTGGHIKISDKRNPKIFFLIGTKKTFYDNKKNSPPERHNYCKPK